MLNYNDIRERAYIVLDGEPYEVVESSIKKKNRQKPANQTKVKNLITGAVRQVAFHQSDKVEEAEIDKKKSLYLFKKDNRQTGQTEYWFCATENRGDRFFLEQNMVDSSFKFIKENQEVDVLLFRDEPIGVQLPVKVTLKVTEAPPAVKGNTATGATKTVILETGAEVSTPLFINDGDELVVKVETGEYVERAK